MPWFQDPIQSNINDLRNVRREANKHFGNKKKEYLKAKIDGLETNSNVKISETYTGASVILRRVTSLELI
jgi:hypothetical protein